MHNIIVILVLAIIVLNVFDYISTSLVISKNRGREINPVMTFAMAKFGKFWWVVKLVFLPVAYALLSTNNEWLALGASIFFLALYSYVVWNNYMVLWRQR